MTRALGVALLVTGLFVPLVPLALWALAGEFRYPDLLPTPSTRGLALLADDAVLAALGTSTLVAVSVAGVAAVIGTAAGRALGTYRFPGRGPLTLLLLAPVLVPTLAVTLGVQVTFIRLGLADTVLGVVLVQLIPAVPYVTLVTAAAFAAADRAGEDAAQVLGAGAWQRWCHVVLPGVRPALVLATLFAFLISWSEYILTLLIGGGTVQTLPLLLFAAIGSADTTTAASLALVIAGPPVLLVALTARELAGRGRAPIVPVRP